METKTLTLAEFLLARIAEDEARLREPGSWARECQECAFLSDHTPGYTVDRLLAECEAKRRIVEDFEILHRDYQVTHDPTTEARRFQACVAIAHLAAVYADHPDYRDEWRP